MPSFSRGAIPIMSMNLLLPDEGEAVIWRGPMVSGAIRQFFSDVQWGELDYLIVDLPPGTSDAPLTVMQALPVDGVVLVTTPQAVATMVVTKAVKLVKQLGGDILGVVENMAYVKTPDGQRLEVFGPSQGLKLVIAANAPLIAKIPIDPAIARDADSGDIETYLSPEAEDLVDNFLKGAPMKAPPAMAPGARGGAPCCGRRARPRPRTFRRALPPRRPHRRQHPRLRLSGSAGAPTAA